MIIYVVYSSFIDDPSRVKGIYSSKEKAEQVEKEWKKSQYMTDPVYIEEMELDVTYEDPVVLS